MTMAIRFGPTALRRLLAVRLRMARESSVSAGDIRVSPPSVAPALKGLSVVRICRRVDYTARLYPLTVAC